MKKRSGLPRILALTAAVCLGLAGCSAGNAFSGSSTSAQNNESIYYEYDSALQSSPFEEAAVTGDVSAEAAGGGPSAVAMSNQTDSSRKIIRNGEVSLETMEFDQAVQQVSDLAGELGGYLQSSSIQGLSMNSSRRSGRYANIVMKVPANELEACIVRLGEICHLVSQSTSGEDVSDHYYDTQSRMNSLKVQEQRLLELLEQSGDLETLLQIETKLAEVRYEIESLNTTLARIDNQVAYSTVRIELREVVEYQEVTPDITFGDRLASTFKDSLERFAGFCEDLLFAAIYLLPGLLLLTAIVVIILVIIRIATRGRRKARREQAAGYPPMSGYPPPAEASQEDEKEQR